MKKTFPLKEPGKADPRVVDAVKHEVRKYVKRERRKTLPEGFTEWNFNCKAGPAPATATVRELDDLGAAIDEVAATGGTEVYVEILAQAGHRPPAPGAALPPTAPLPPLAPLPPTV